MPGLPDGTLLQALPSSSLEPPGPALDPGWQQQTILMLKEQNRLLTQVRRRRGVGGSWQPGRP